MRHDKRSSKRLYAYFAKYILSPEEVVKQGISLVLKGKENDPRYIKRNFSHIVTEIEKQAYSVFLESQSDSWRKALTDYISETARLDNFEGKARSVTEAKSRFLTDNFHELDSFFLSLSQSRRARAGGAFQHLIKDLFKRLDYPFDSDPVIDGQPDFVIPSIEYFRKNPIDCIIFTVKRTLRERWRQIVTEGTKGLGFFLATIDTSVSENQLREMAANRIFLIVPRSIKEEKSVYSATANVIAFESFFENYLDPYMNRWKKRDII